MSRSKATQLFLRIITTLSQWLLAGTFLFSGFVKAMDPMGMEHKLAAYLVHWGFDVPAGSFYLDVHLVCIFCWVCVSVQQLLEALRLC